MLCWCWCYSCSWWRFRKWLTNYFVFISLTFNLKYKFSLNRKLKRLSRQHLSLFFMSHHDARYKFQAISPIMTHSNPYNADTQQLTHKQDGHISAHTKMILARSITNTNNNDLEYLTHKWYWQTVSHTQQILTCSTLFFGTSVRRSSGRRSGVAVRAVDCWQWRSGH